MRIVATLIGIAVLMTACGSSDAPRAIVSAPAATAHAAPLVGVDDEARPGLAWIDTDIDGVALTYALAVPDGLNSAATDPVPILLAFPPGGQDRNLVEVGLDGYWLDTALAEGFVVISPVAPDGVLFFQGSESLIPGLIAEVSARYPAEGGKVHVAGISNGGVSTFRVAAEYPDLVASLTVLPGFPVNQSDLAALDTTTVPITMWAGETDTRWVQEMLAVESRLTPLGVPVAATVVAGAGHIIAGDAGFVSEVWAAITGARPSA